MNENNSPVYKSVPAATELRKVNGFDPLRFLRRVTSPKSGEKLWKLELPYKRLWFRLACPNGRMVVKPLRITDQLAIFEALVYAQKDDEEPLSRFTASVSPQETPDGKYVEAAQDSALNTALENAGFGVQLCDFVQSAGSSRYGSEIPASAVANAKAAAAATAPLKAPAEKPVSVEKHTPSAPQVQKEKPVPTATAAPEAPKPVEVKPELVTEPKVEPVQATQEEAEPIQAATAPTPAKAEPPVTHTAPVSEQNVQQASADPLTLLMKEPHSEAPQMEAAEPESQQVQTAHSYTADMTVEEICKVMSIEDARAYVVQGGVCKGWTLEQVAERRAPSLRFYVCSNTGDNVLKAAATLMLQELNQRKAG